MKPYADGLERLRAANPMPVQPERANSAVARAALASILQQPFETYSDASGRSRLTRWRGANRSSRRLLVLVAAVVLTSGAAVAATDPLGWWSANPTYARYGSNPAVHMRTPTEQHIACRDSGSALRCSPATFDPSSGVVLVNGHRSTAQSYTLLTPIAAPVHGLSRSAMLAEIAEQHRTGALTAAQTKKLRSDLAAVPNSFFTEFELASRFGTYGNSGSMRNGLTQVPPAGVPSLIVCEPAGRGLSCQNLNGDEHVPIGAGVYAAAPSHDWPYKRIRPDSSGLPRGISFTPAEYRVLADMLRVGSTRTTLTKIGSN